MARETTNDPNAGPLFMGWLWTDLLTKPYEELKTKEVIALVNYWEAWPVHYWHENLVTGGTTHYEGLLRATRTLSLAAEAYGLDAAALVEAADLVRRYVTNLKLARYYTGRIGTMPLTALDWIRKLPARHRPTDAEFTLMTKGFTELWRLHSKLNLPTDSDDRPGHL